jgi:hypothetical protein
VSSRLLDHVEPEEGAEEGEEEICILTTRGPETKENKRDGLETL